MLQVVVSEYRTNGQIEITKQFPVVKELKLTININVEDTVSCFFYTIKYIKSHYKLNST